MDDGNTLFAAVAIGIVFSIVIGLIVVMGSWTGKAELTGNCDNFGAFMVDDVKYECRRAVK
jgi:hypothetical protein